MDFTKLNQILKDEPSYRLKQVLQAIFKDFKDDWSQVTTLSLPLREKLTQEYPLEINGQTFIGKDKNTAKALITLHDGLQVESVLLRHDDHRNTVCVSSQIGCPLGCLFCATGKLGYKRNLKSDEIIKQVLYFSRLLKKENQRVSNVVFMGMGEPFLNYENVLKAIRDLNDPELFNIGARHMSISTAGVIEGIKKFSKENLQVNLALSLHAPNEALRSKLMPINKKYPLKKVLAAIDNYIKQTNRRVMFEYIMIRGLNDSAKYAEELGKLMQRPLCFINLICYNPTGKFKPSSAEQIKKFKSILYRYKVHVTERYRFGTDIDAACGQLAYKKRRRFVNHAPVAQRKSATLRRSRP